MERGGDRPYSRQWYNVTRVSVSSFVYPMPELYLSRKLNKKCRGDIYGIRGCKVIFIRVPRSRIISRYTYELAKERKKGSEVGWGEVVGVKNEK